MKNILFLMSVVALNGLFFTSCDKGDDEVNSKIVGIWRETHYADWYGGDAQYGKLEDFDWEAEKHEYAVDDAWFVKFKSDGIAWFYNGDGWDAHAQAWEWYINPYTYSLKGSTFILRGEGDEIDDEEGGTVVSLTDNTLVIEWCAIDGDGSVMEVFRDWYTKVSSLPDAAQKAELDL
jgi:hypothetical protein